MTNYIEILRKHGIEIPKDKEDDIKKEIAANYKTVTEYDRKVELLETEKSRADAAEEKLASFEGLDPEKVKEEIQNYKKEIEQAKKEYKEQLEKRDYNDLVEKAVGNIKFTSASAKKAFMAELTNDPLKVKNGSLIGFDDFVNSYKETDPEAFAVEGGKQPAKFTISDSQKQGHEPVTKESIYAIKDRAERQKQMAEHIDLWN